MLNVRITVLLLHVCVAYQMNNISFFTFLIYLSELCNNLYVIFWINVECENLILKSSSDQCLSKYIQQTHHLRTFMRIQKRNVFKYAHVIMTILAKDVCQLYSLVMSTELHVLCLFVCQNIVLFCLYFKLLIKT